MKINSDMSATTGDTIYSVEFEIGFVKNWSQICKYLK